MVDDLLTGRVAGEATGDPEGAPDAAAEVDDGPRLPPPPVTGDAAVDAAVALLTDVVGRPLEAQPAGYESVHRTLTDRLADLEG